MWPKGLAEGFDASGGKNKKEKEKNKWQSYP